MLYDLFMEKDYFVLYTPEDMLKAYKLFDIDFSKSEIFETLRGQDDIKKQVCLIKLKSIDTKEEAENLAAVLTGQHGPVREICSFKINEFLKNEKYRKLFNSDNIREIMLNGLNDIIPTVARNILEVIKFLPEQDKVRFALESRILELDNIEEDIPPLSNHEITKKTFKLYWYLETLAEIAEECKKDEQFIKIIEKTYNHEDYTIREKVAKILAKIDGFKEFKDFLKNDTNPYVFSKLH